MDVEGDDVPLYVAIEAGTRWRAAKEGPRSLGDVVREMEPEEQTSSLGLGVAGALLSGGPLGAGNGEDQGEGEGEGGAGA